MKNLSSQLPKGVKILAVSKGHQVSVIRQLAEVGQRDFGESRLQEALPKIKELSQLKSIRWHFIGRLQSNKVRSVVKNFDFIHSVDSESLATRISRVSLEESRILKVFLQVKFAEDPNKAGFSPDELIEVIPKISQLPNLQLNGLMTIAPLNTSLETREKIFHECRLLANTLLFEECSMGMSSDWQEAVKAGSTWLRLGFCLFGEKQEWV